MYLIFVIIINLFFIDFFVGYLIVEVWNNGMRIVVEYEKVMRVCDNIGILLIFYRKE